MSRPRDDHGGGERLPEADTYPGKHRISMDMGSTTDLARALRQDAENLAYKVGQAQQRMTNTTLDFHGKGLGLDERNPRGAEIAGFYDTLSTGSVMFTDKVSQTAEREGMWAEFTREGFGDRDQSISERIIGTANRLDLIGNTYDDGPSETHGGERS